MMKIGYELGMKFMELLRLPKSLPVHRIVIDICANDIIKYEVYADAERLDDPEFLATLKQAGGEAQLIRWRPSEKEVAQQAWFQKPRQL